ncbi:MAG: hypothetical protein E6L05_04940 [Thaumarchaeota archaeon]|nr:MAG: hypothetical protein E6L05_04940 [Nitrososphaerota archaeon]
MDYSEEQIREILELKEWISEEIEKHQKDIEKLEKNLAILDSVIKQSSFNKASSLILKNEKKSSAESAKMTLIPIKGNEDSKIIANVHVTPDEVVIIPSDDVTLDVETQPFKSFFLGRIIGGMESKDNLDVQNGKISEDVVINCIINKDGNKIREILIKNYRERERVTEIINTASWSFSRMIENSKK